MTIERSSSWAINYIIIIIMMFRENKDMDALHIIIIIVVKIMIRVNPDLGALSKVRPVIIIITRNNIIKKIMMIVIRENKDLSALLTVRPVIILQLFAPPSASSSSGLRFVSETTIKIIVTIIKTIIAFIMINNGKTMLVLVVVMLVLVLVLVLVMLVNPS